METDGDLVASHSTDGSVICLRHENFQSTQNVLHVQIFAHVQNFPQAPWFIVYELAVVEAILFSMHVKFYIDFIC